MTAFFREHPRINAAFLVGLILISLFIIPRAWGFGEYFTAVLLTICLPAPVLALVRLTRSGALGRSRK